MSIKYTDATLMPFGRYKGQKLIYIPDTYFKWLYDQGVTGSLKEYIEDNFNIKPKK